MIKQLLSALVLSAVALASSAGNIGSFAYRNRGRLSLFNGVDANGKLIGFDVDIAMALCKEMKANCELVRKIGMDHPRTSRE